MASTERLAGMQAGHLWAAELAHPGACLGPSPAHLLEWAFLRVGQAPELWTLEGQWHR